MIAVTLGAVALTCTELRMRVVAAAMLLALVVTDAPWLVAVAAAGGAIAVGWVRLRSRRVRAMQNSMDLADLCDLTVVGLTGGLGLQSALHLAATSTGGSVGAEAEQILRSARVAGASEAMAAADGIGRPLYRTLGRAAASGAAVLEPVAQLADELSAELETQRLEAVRRRPVAMLFPLTLLILPGFLLLAVAPAVLEAFGRLDM